MFAGIRRIVVFSVLSLPAIGGLTPSPIMAMSRLEGLTQPAPNPEALPACVVSLEEGNSWEEGCGLELVVVAGTALLVAAAGISLAGAYASGNPLAIAGATLEMAGASLLFTAAESVYLTCALESWDV